MHQNYKFLLGYRLVGCLGLILLFQSNVSAQLDTVNYHIGLLTGLSNQNYFPHYITANRFGILNDQDYAVGLFLGGAETNFKASKNWSFGLGFNAIAKLLYIQQQTNVFLQEGYLKAKFNVVELSAGRMKRTLGTHAEDISTGSLALSGNALPIPQILLAVNDYATVPFTKGFVEFKGSYAHAWLGQERYIKDAYLHEKSFYLKFGGEYKINFSAGLVHYVVWSGKAPVVGRLPSSFKDYLRVIRGKSAEEVDTNHPTPVIGEAANALGDHKGIYDFGLYVHLKDVDLLLYHQTPFEDWTGTRLFRNRDRLLGVNIKNKSKNKIVSSVVYEFLFTKYQSGPGKPGGPNDPPGDSGYGYDYGGRDNYYNNYLYKTGWVYKNRIIGTPLFYTKQRMKFYDKNFIDPDEKLFNFKIINNRIIAHHIGIQGIVSNSFQYKFLSTFTKNYGTYGGINGGINKWGSIENPDLEYAFKPPKNQNYFLLEIESHPFSKSWSLLTAITWDVGELYQNLGMLIGLRRNGIIKIN